MKGKLVEQGKGGKEITVASPKMSISELARQLESKAISRFGIDRETLMKVAIYFLSRGYSEEDLGEILSVTPRTIQRYLKKVQSENSLNLGPEFQGNIIKGFMNSWRSRCQRLLKLSYSDDLSDCEKAKILIVLHKVEVEGMMLLEKIGYLAKWQTLADIKMAFNKESKVAESKKPEESLTSYSCDYEESDIKPISLKEKCQFVIDRAIVKCQAEKTNSGN